MSCWVSVGEAERGRLASLCSASSSNSRSRRPALVVVQGDTNTALGGALAANALEIPVAHVEAGLRSFDRLMPEEHNRVLTDHLADLCLAPTNQSRNNLLAERIAEARIAVTGNTVVDVASRLMPGPEEESRSVAQVRGCLRRASFWPRFTDPRTSMTVERLGTAARAARSSRTAGRFSGASTHAPAHSG